MVVQSSLRPSGFPVSLAGMPSKPSHSLMGAGLALVFLASPSLAEAGSIQPGRAWNDDKGNRINAHGFCVLEHEAHFYWYGSLKIPGRTESEKNEAGVSCYSSQDLVTWKNEGLVLDKSTPGMHAEVATSGILDRPKVVFNPKSGKFILYFKLYPAEASGNTAGTSVAYTGVADAAKPTGPFEYRGRFLGAGSPQGSGDFAIYQDETGIHHICVRKPDKTLVIGRMTADGLRPEGSYVPMEGVSHATEAPVLFRHQGRFHLIGSGSTGWKPNASRSFSADRIEGPYVSHGNPCRGINPHNRLGPELSFGGQTTHAFPYRTGSGDTRWVAMFDIWLPSDPVNSGYIWLPMRMDEGKPVIEWHDAWHPKAAAP